MNISDRNTSTHHYVHLGSCVATFIAFTEGMEVSKDFHRVGKVLAVHLPGQHTHCRQSSNRLQTTMQMGLR